MVINLGKESVKKNVSVFILSILLLQKIVGQNQLTDQSFFIPNQSLLYLNPSFAGSNGGLRNQMAYTRLKINSIKSFAFYNGLDYYLNKMHGGVALSYMTNIPDKLTKHRELNLIYAQHFSLYSGKLKIIPSLQASYVDDVNASKVFTNADSIRITVISPWSSERVKKVDFSTGLVINYKTFYAGISVFHINGFDLDAGKISDLNTRYCFHTSYNMHLHKNLLVNLMIRVYSQNQYYSLETTLNAVFRKHWIVSANNALDKRIFTSIGYRHNFFTATAGYSIPLRKFVGVFKLVEFGLSYNLRNKEQRKKLVDIERW